MKRTELDALKEKIQQLTEKGSDLDKVVDRLNGLSESIKNVLPEDVQKVLENRRPAR